MRVFVTDGENRAALAVTRSLGRRGHEVIVGERQTPSLAQTSRYCAGCVVYPDPVSASDEFVEYAARVVRDRRVDLLVPVAEITTFLVTSHRHQFDVSCAIPFASAEVFQRAVDKVDVVQTAARIGVPVPQTVVVSDPDHLPEHDFGFPLVIKPRQSRIRTPAGWVMTSVSYAADRDQLIRDLGSRPRHEFPVMLQEQIVGPGMGVFAYYHGGRPIAIFSHRRLRERPPRGGVSVLSESVLLCPVMREHATRLLEELGWDGVAMVEFKQDLRDGVPKLMEINGRFWGSLQLAVDAGVDFPGLLAQSVTGRFETQVPYRIGVRNRWFWGDVDSLLLTLVSGDGAPHLPQGRLRSAVEFMRFWGRDLHYDNPKPDDFRPWMWESYRWLRAASPRLRIPVVGRRDSPAVHTSTGARDQVQLSIDAGSHAPWAVRAQIVAALDQVGLNEQAWNALAAESATNSVFQTHQWTHSWWKTFGDEYEPLFVAARNACGTVGVAPLVIEQSPARERVIHFLGDGRADYCDVLARTDEKNVVTVMFETVLASERWDVIELNNVPEQSPTVEAVRTLCEAAGYPILIYDQFVCPTLLIRGHEAEVMQIARKPSARRPENYFKRTGRFACRDFTRPTEIQPYLEAFFAQHITRWSSTGSPSLFLNERNRSFYRELTRSLAGTPWLLFSVAEFNDHPVAFHYGFDYDDAMIWYKPSFDVAYAQHSPGLGLVRHLIDRAVQLERREFDFTVGDEAFKRRFTNHTRRTVKVRIFQHSARYMLERSKRSVIGALKKVSLTSFRGAR